MKPIEPNFIYPPRETGTVRIGGYDPTPLKNTIIVALGHKARHGKSWVAKWMASQLPGAKVMGFADTLKAYCRIAYGMRRKEPTLLQDTASDLRAADHEVFIRALYDTLVEEPPPMVLIPDLRYENEARMIQDIGGFLVKVVRLQEGPRYLPYVSPDRDPSHQSEIELDTFAGWDHRIIAASGQLDLLEQHSRVVLERILRTYVERRTALAGEARVRAAADDAVRAYSGGSGYLYQSCVDDQRPADGLSESLRCQGPRADRTAPTQPESGDSGGRPDVPGGDSSAGRGVRGNHAGPVVPRPDRGRVRSRCRVAAVAKRRAPKRRAGSKK